MCVFLLSETVGADEFDAQKHKHGRNQSKGNQHDLGFHHIEPVASVADDWGVAGWMR